MKINVWNNSVSLILHKYHKNSFASRKTFIISAMLCWKTDFFKKTKNLSQLFSCHAVSNTYLKFLCLGSFCTLSFVFERVCQDAGYGEALFFIVIHTGTYIIRASFSESFCFCETVLLFLHLKSKNLKRCFVIPCILTYPFRQKEIIEL